MMKVNFIEVHNTELDCMLPIPEIELELGETMDGLAVRCRPTISRAIAAAVDLMVGFNTDTMPCFSVKDTDVIFSINRKDAVYSVDQCIKYFEEIEDYEKCIRLTQVKSKL